MISIQNLINPRKDIILWFFSYLLIALSFNFFANDNSFKELLRIPSFYTDVIFSITITFLIAFYLKKLNTKLDLKYSWYEEFKTRLLKQFIYGVLLPLILAVLAEIIYLKAINISIRDSSILNLELPLSFIYLILINITSFANYLFKNKQKETIIVKEQIIEFPPKNLEFINIQKGYVVLTP